MVIMPGKILHTPSHSAGADGGTAYLPKDRCHAKKIVVRKFQENTAPAWFTDGLRIEKNFPCNGFLQGLAPVT